MLNTLLATTRGFSDVELLRQVVRLAGQEREATVELVSHLAELDARKLFLGEGYGSLFAYCTGALRLSEHAAFNRIEAARLSRRFPAVLDLLASGDLNLSSLRLLAPHLRPDNFEIVVARARRRTKREVEALVAELAPRPDAAAWVRRIPERTGAAPVTTLPPVPVVGLLSVLTAPPGKDRSTVALGAADSEAVSNEAPGPRPAGPEGHAEAQPAVTRSGPGPRSEVAPLSPGRYGLQFTIDAGAHDKLRKAQDLLRREIPSGDPGAIFDRALTLLLEDVARRKLAVTSRPGPPARASRGSRHVPAGAKRAVWLRDGGRCAFQSRSGRRCAERAFLEFHHREPYAMGGDPTVGNISLRCSAHNRYEARFDFGAGARPPDSPRGESSSPMTT